MTPAQRRVILIVATFLCAFSSGHGQAPEGRPTGPLTVLVFDYAGLDAKSLASTAEQAAALFRRVNVFIVWEQCRTELQPQAQPCALVADPSVLALRILPATLPPFDRDGGETFGFAFPPRTNGFANVAAVFWNRVRNQAESKKMEPATLLAAVIAHEAGHLLLGPNSHFTVGLMKGVWDDHELRLLAQRSLGFWSGQGKDLRAAVVARIDAARPSGPPMTLASGKWPWVGL